MHIDKRHRESGGGMEVVKRPSRVIGVDLSVSPIRVTVEGVDVEGVTRAAVVMLPGETPILELRICAFDVTGGTLPHGWKHAVRQHDQD